MNSYTIANVERSPKRIILHCGTNNTRRSQSPGEIAIVHLANSTKTDKNEIYTLCSLVPIGMIMRSILRSSANRSAGRWQGADCFGSQT